MIGFNSLKVIFVDQDPKGIQILEPHMESITIMIIPREYVKKAVTLETPEYKRGIYFLVDDKKESLYIGKTEQGVKRLADHDKNKDFWSKAIMFLNQDKIFTLDVISGLEKFLIVKAQETNVYNLVNTQEPKHKSDTLELAAIEKTYEDIKFIMSYLGYDLEKPPVIPGSEISPAPILREQTILTLDSQKRKSYAKGYVTDKNTFVVLAGSTVSESKHYDNEAGGKSRAKIRDELEYKGIISGRKFTKDYEFSSSSAAACVIYGGSASGPAMWKDKNGVPLGEMMSSKKGCKILIKKVSITNLSTDAIVNAANSGLQEGAGVCGAIFAAADHKKLQAACNAIGHCDTGSAVITPGFDSKAKFIIHAVGPIWQDGNSGEPQQLYSAYKRSLELAVEHNCHSIGFPLISTGIFGYPKDKAWRKAIQACKDYLDKNPYVDLEIVFAVLDEGILALGQKSLAEIVGD